MNSLPSLPCPMSPSSTTVSWDCLPNELNPYLRSVSGWNQTKSVTKQEKCRVLSSQVLQCCVGSKESQIPNWLLMAFALLRDSLPYTERALLSCHCPPASTTGPALQEPKQRNAHVPIDPWHQWLFRALSMTTHIRTGASESCPAAEEPF